MAVATAAKPAAAAATGSAAAAKIPFVSASWEHTEINQDSPIVVTPGTTARTFVITVNAGGFLRGLWLTVTATGGELGATGAALVADAPWSLVQSIEMETVQGKPLIYPISGWQMYMASLFCRPWDGDPGQYAAYARSIDPAFQIRFYNEVRATLACLPNTDARAKFRVRLTIAPLVGGLVTKATGVTAPTITIAIQKDDYGQPDPVDILGRQTAQTPPGLAWQRFLSTQTITSTSGQKWYQLDRVGNFLRNILLEVRNPSGVRTTLTGTPIIWQLDNQFLVTETRAKRKYEMARFYGDEWGDSGGHTVLAKSLPAGMYVYSRWHKPGDRTGMTWLATSTASLLQFSIQGAPAGGTITALVEDLAPTGVGTSGHQFGL